MPYQEPDFLPWDGRRVPVTLLGGYLGAGKTSIINDVLRRTDRPIAVLVNDVGAVNVDAKLLRRRNRQTIEFTDGCVCCSLSDGLGRAFDELRAQATPPEHVVLELSGVAEPAKVAPWTNSAGFLLDGTVVVVDAEQFPALAKHDVVGPTVRTQVEAADLVVLTKLDLANDAQQRASRELLARLAPTAPIIERDSALAGSDLAGSILSLGARVTTESSLMPAATLFDAHRTELIGIPRPTTEAELHAILDRLPDDVLRAKGIAERSDGEQFVVQVVGRRRSIEPTLLPERTTPTDLVVIRPLAL